MHEITVYIRKVKKLRLGKKKKSKTQTCVWEAQNALPKCTLNATKKKNAIIIFRQKVKTKRALNLRP